MKIFTKECGQDNKDLRINIYAAESAELFQGLGAFVRSNFQRILKLMFLASFKIRSLNHCSNRTEKI